MTKLREAQKYYIKFISRKRIETYETNLASFSHLCPVTTPKKWMLDNDS